MQHKKIILIIGVLIVLVLMGLSLKDKLGLFKKEFKQEWKSCTTDSDCVLVSIPGCCPCDKDPVNSQFIDEYNKYRNSNTGSCWNVACTQCLPKSKAKIPRCVSNVCVATDE